MSRLHPFDWLFREFAESEFPDVKKSIATPTPTLADFIRSPKVEELLKQIQPPDGAVDPTEVHEYLALLYSIYRFWDAGETTATLERETLEPALDNPADSPPALPVSAMYIQLPPSWFWTRITDETPFEPVDGIFLSVGGTNTEFTAVAVLGLREERQGFSQVTVTASEEDFEKAQSEVRKPKFQPVMDGGEAAGFRSIVSQAELLHLSHLALTCIAG
ncbi:MAG: hypothetical protein OEZ54_05875 [Gemmatimonadota bacterium]|nr:hypothetical protein [Gemmatimonadota bacterium]